MSESETTEIKCNGDCLCADCRQALRSGMLLLVEATDDLRVIRRRLTEMTDA